MQGYTIFRKSTMFTIDVKLNVFQSHCCHIYLPQLWTKYNQTTTNNLLKMFFYCILKVTRFRYETFMIQLVMFSVRAEVNQHLTCQ